MHSVASQSAPSLLHPAEMQLGKNAKMYMSSDLAKINAYCSRLHYGCITHVRSFLKIDFNHVHRAGLPTLLPCFTINPIRSQKNLMRVPTLLDSLRIHNNSLLHLLHIPSCIHLLYTPLVHLLPLSSIALRSAPPSR